MRQAKKGNPIRHRLNKKGWASGGGSHQFFQSDGTFSIRN